jgi:hypothetical protein
VHCRDRLGFGIATLFICEALLANGPEARHVAADPYQLVSLPQHKTSYAGVGLQILEEAGVSDLVEFHAEESQHSVSVRAGLLSGR